jgi:divalent metal cation (Fe/Co/Zn/Cd) transporter
MGNYHSEKWIYKTVLGCLLIAAGIFFMYYALTHLRGNWTVYASICSGGVTIGVYLLSSGAVNKVKSDMIKKQKMKQQSSS